MSTRFDPETLQPYPPEENPHPACPKHPRWLFGAPPAPEGLVCPYCEAEARKPEETPDGMSAWEHDPLAVLDRKARRVLGNGVAAEKAMAEVRRRDTVRAARDAAVEERRREILDLEGIIESKPTSGYVPPPTKAGGNFEPILTPAQRKRHAARVRDAKARLEHLRSAPLQFERTTYEPTADLRAPAERTFLPRHMRLTPAEREALAKGQEPLWWSQEEEADAGGKDGEEEG